MDDNEETLRASPGVRNAGADSHKIYIHRPRFRQRRSFALHGAQTRKHARQNVILITTSMQLVLFVERPLDIPASSVGGKDIMDDTASKLADLKGEGEMRGGWWLVLGVA